MFVRQRVILSKLPKVHWTTLLKTSSIYLLALSEDLYAIVVSYTVYSIQWVYYAVYTPKGSKATFSDLEQTCKIYFIPVTMVNQDHLHNVIKSSMDRTEPGNTVCINLHARNTIQRSASFCTEPVWTEQDYYKHSKITSTVLQKFLSQDHEIS